LTTSALTGHCSIYGHKKQGAKFGHTKIQGKPLLVRGLNALTVTVSTPIAALIELPSKTGEAFPSQLASGGRGRPARLQLRVNCFPDEPLGTGRAKAPPGGSEQARVQVPDQVGGRLAPSRTNS
jgi:hypothetical protein